MTLATAGSRSSSQPRGVKLEDCSPNGVALSSNSITGSDHLILLPPIAWTAVVDSCRQGEFDVATLGGPSAMPRHPYLEVYIMTGDRIVVRNVRGIVKSTLYFTADAWTAFVNGVKLGHIGPQPA